MVLAPATHVERRRITFARLACCVERLEVFRPAVARNADLRNGGVLEPLGHFLEIVARFTAEHVLLLLELADAAGQGLLVVAGARDETREVLAAQIRHVHPVVDTTQGVLRIGKHVVESKDRCGHLRPYRQFVCHRTTSNLQSLC